jgi:deazaflavin-dependent oxidoreductase (nitroreductase family)
MSNGNETVAAQTRVQAPRRVRLFSPLLRWLLDAGVPLGFNRLVTIRGRKTGLARTTPLAVIQMGDRRWVWSPWGDVQWVRNLRASGRATVATGGRHTQAEEVTATELDAAARVAYFRDVLGPLARSVPFGTLFIRLVDGVRLDDAEAAARGHPVFELRPTTPSTS